MSVKCSHISFPNRKLQLYPFRIQCNCDRLFNVCSCYLHFISCFLSQLLILKSLHSNTLQHFNIVADLISDSVSFPPNKQQLCCVAIYGFLIFYSIYWNGSRWKNGCLAQIDMKNNNCSALVSENCVKYYNKNMISIHYQTCHLKCINRTTFLLCIIM